MCSIIEPMYTIAVLRGGKGGEHEVSLRSGATVIESLKRLNYRVVDVFIDKQEAWYVRGKPMTPERALMGVSLAWNVLHGNSGEDGELQRSLDRLGVKYTGSGTYASVVAYNKALTKEVLAKHGVLMAQDKKLTVSPNLKEEALAAFRAFSPPVFIKPATSGSTVGMTLAKTFDEFWVGVTEAFTWSSTVLVEEYIKGKEGTAGVVEGLRNEALYALPLIEIIPPKENPMFDYDAKYSGKSIERCPGNFTKAEALEMQRVARLAHEVLGMRHYSRTDFIVTKRGCYFLETNNAAGVGMTGESLFPKSLYAVGITLDEFVQHVTERAMA